MDGRKFSEDAISGKYEERIWRLFSQSAKNKGYLKFSDN